MENTRYVCNIRNLRKAKHISQTQLANSAGIETSTVSRMEDNNSDPKMSTLWAIAKALDVKVDELYTEITEEDIKKEKEREFFARANRYKTYVSTMHSSN